jgi:hypothetical protein
MAPAAVDASLGLSRAKAALWLLGELHFGDLGRLQREPDRMEPIANKQDHAFTMSHRDLASWIEGMCLDALEAGLRETEADVMKTPMEAGR